MTLQDKLVHPNIYYSAVTFLKARYRHKHVRFGDKRAWTFATHIFALELYRWRRNPLKVVSLHTYLLYNGVWILIYIFRKWWNSELQVLKVIIGLQTVPGKSVVTFCNLFSLNHAKFTFHIDFFTQENVSPIYMNSTEKSRKFILIFCLFVGPTFQKMHTKNMVEEIMSQTYWCLTESSLKVSDNPRQLFWALHRLNCTVVDSPCYICLYWDHAATKWYLNKKNNNNMKLCCNWPFVDFECWLSSLNHNGVTFELISCSQS